MSDTFWKDTTDFLLTGMGTDLFDKSANLITNIAPLFSMGFGIYFMIIILNAYGRGFDGNAIDLAKKTVAWLIIIACAFNAAQYQKIANMAYEFPEWLASTFNGRFEASAIDTAWDSIMQLIEKLLAKAATLTGLTQLPDKIMVFMAAGIIILLGGIFFGIILAYYLVAKISLAMVLLIGPLFLGMMLFSSTRQYAMNWISQIFNYSVTISFFTILMSLQMNIFDNHIKSLVLDDYMWRSPLQIFGILPVFLLVTILLIIVAFNIPSIASALTGGAGAGGFSTMTNFVREALNGGNKESPVNGLGWNKAKGQFNDARAKIFGNRIKKG
ncbi:type IV secretion system protein [Simonsiella muelleri]|nr:type IV secretion system protein [Simonsiella muelleri]AUX61031.1 hypothetical protein BWP33_03835 [Simonsiella muelleri ATCC 29453]UBQ53073.1 type IV secretion system protein [Simonsiella muelleri]